MSTGFLEVCRTWRPWWRSQVAGWGEFDLLKRYADYFRDDGFDEHEAEFRAFLRLNREHALPREFYVAIYGVPQWEIEVQQIDVEWAVVRAELDRVAAKAEAYLEAHRDELVLT